MLRANKTCRVCGKEYHYCKSEAVGKFRYQDVACSPECGEKYFKAIMESRGEIAPEKDSVNVDAVDELKVTADAKEEVIAEEKEDAPFTYANKFRKKK